MNYLFLSITYITFSVVELTIFTLLAGITALLSLFEDISSVLFELASDSSGVPPRSSFPTEKCAVLILGAQEGVGRNAALQFSELGYTVFALCPNRQDDAGHLVSSGGSRGVASLLYIWHNRKERSRSIPWGLVAPMQLNMWSRSQRQAVHETVLAHCNAYDLRLVALIISHDPKSHPGTGPSLMDTLDATRRADEEDAWRNTVLDEVTEPVLMAYDYRELLAEASGRIIILSNFAESRCGTPLALLSLASRTATAESLANMLEFEGIRVSSIYFGPLAEDSMTRSPDDRGNNRRFPQSFGIRAGVIRYAGTEDIQETYSTGQPLTHRPATCGAVPAPEIRLYCWAISHFARCTEVSTCWLEIGSDESHTLGDVAEAGIGMILFLTFHVQYVWFRARQMMVPPLLTRWEEDNPSESAMVDSRFLAK
ncbi:hypothetical protein BJY52DRAFT_1220327 [Lactarius psammicola]|nr:hypothetical protein BJY52DRAFT_1220327 [Lactarius psammicola]